MLNYLLIIYANIIGIYLFNEKYDSLNIIGSAIIFSSVIYTFLNN